jgi:hypothetical protein
MRWFSAFHGYKTPKQVEGKKRRRPFHRHQTKTVRPHEIAGSTVPSRGGRTCPEYPGEGPTAREPSPESLLSQTIHRHPDRCDLHLRRSRDDHPWRAKRKVAACAPRPILCLLRHRVGLGRTRGAASWWAAAGEPVEQGIEGPHEPHNRRRQPPPAPKVYPPRCLD